MSVKSSGLSTSPEAAQPGVNSGPVVQAQVTATPLGAASATKVQVTAALAGAAPVTKAEATRAEAEPSAEVEGVPSGAGPARISKAEATDSGPAPAAKAGHTRRLSARERLLAAADELFYENGINTVGIDRIIEHAGVAKASLYDCFGSKDELVRAYLQQRGASRQARINERMSRYETPEEKILSLFDLLAEVISQPSYHGCAFARAGADASSSQSVKAACEQSRAFLLDRLTGLAREAGVNDPELVGKQLVLLYDGASTAAYMDGDRNAASAARTLAEQLLTNAATTTRPGRRSR